MNFIAEINVMPLKDLLDPAGKAVRSGLENLGITGINDVRIGKHIKLQISCSAEDEAMEIAKVASQKLLANPVMEQADIKIVQLS
jgi:phosphoribosylformylglycinamidine synthase